MTGLIAESFLDPSTSKEFLVQFVDIAQKHLYSIHPKK